MELSIEVVKKALGAAVPGGQVRAARKAGSVSMVLDGAKHLGPLQRVRGRLHGRLVCGEFADGVLRARRMADDKGAEPLVVLVGGFISDRLAEQVAAYAAEFAGGVAFALLDERGRVDVWNGQGVKVSEKRGESEVGLGSFVCEPVGVYGDQVAPVASPFSDLGQWLIKVLLGSRVDPSMLGVPRIRVPGPRRRGARFQGVGAVAEAAEISAGSVSRLLGGLVDGGWLDGSFAPPKLIRIASLLEAWGAATRGPARSLRASFLLPVKSPKDQLQDALAVWAPAVHDGERVALAGFAACGLHGQLAVRGGPLQLYMEAPSLSGLRALGLRVLEGGEPGKGDVVIWVPRFPQAVFRGVQDQGGLPVCDILQCWLDLRDHPARGREQADAILKCLGLEGKE